MPFCGKCGSQVNDDDRFCAKCGAPRSVVTQSSKQGNSREVYEGTVHKCPNCGAPVNGFQLNCSACGYEFRKNEGGASVSDLAKRLEQLESQRETPSAAKNVAKAFGMSSYDKTSTAKANTISTFVIPNTKEDILEFMILAASNINPAYLAGNVYGDEITKAQEMRPEQNAWYSKMEQAYTKAKLTFSSDPYFVEIERVFNEKKKAVEKEKKKKSTSMAIIITLALGIPILMMVLGYLGLNSLG